MRRLMLVVLLTGCGVAEVDVEAADDELAESTGPLATDVADRSCSVVLRSLGRVAKGPGFETKCVSGSCSVVFTGVMDVSAAALAKGAKPSVMWKGADSTTWTTVAAKKSTGAPAGFTRYTVRLEKKTYSDGLSATGLSRVRLEVAPFVTLADGSRWFDKQRGQGDFDNYVLSQATGFQVADDASVCAQMPVAASLDFSAAGTNSQRGALVAGGKGVIRFPLERLTTCRGTHNGHPAWNIEAFVRFLPSGDVVTGTVRGFETMGGTPSNASAVAVPFSFDVPKSAREAQVWLKNSTGAGSTCEAYDSNFGENFRFEVEAVPFANVAWVGRPGASTSRACVRSEGAPTQLTFDSYLNERACVWFEADVYVPGLTDQTGKAHAVLAEAELWRDGVALPSKPLSFVTRVGNDFRYRFDLPKSELFYGPKWTRFEVRLRFSTNGLTWTSDEKRTVLRDASFCNPAWSGCAVQ